MHSPDGLHLCNSKCAWLLSPYNIYIKIHVVAESPGSVPCIGFNSLLSLPSLIHHLPWRSPAALSPYSSSFHLLAHPPLKCSCILPLHSCLCTFCKDPYKWMNKALVLVKGRPSIDCMLLLFCSPVSPRLMHHLYPII